MTKKIGLWTLVLLAVFAGLCLTQMCHAQTTAPAPPINPTSITEQLGTVTGIVVLSLALVQGLKLLLAKYKVGIVSDLPTPLICVGISMALTLVANLVIGTLQGEWWNLLWQSGLAAAAASGLFTWLKEPMDSPSKTVARIIPFLLPLVLMGGCVGTQPLSSSQQWGIASASVRAAVDSLKVAADSKLISDEDIVAIDPIVKQAFDSLRAMRTAALEGNPITVQWYLAQVQQLVPKITAMVLRAKEMKNVGNSSSSLDSNPGGDERHYGTDYGTARSRRRQARLYARGNSPGGRSERFQRARLGGNGGRGESPLDRWRPGKPIPPITVEIEFD